MWFLLCFCWTALVWGTTLPGLSLGPKQASCDHNYDSPWTLKSNTAGLRKMRGESLAENSEKGEEIVEVLLVRRREQCSHSFSSPPGYMLVKHPPGISRRRPQRHTCTPLPSSETEATEMVRRSVVTFTLWDWQGVWLSIHWIRYFWIMKNVAEITFICSGQFYF